jgi:type II secretory pathway pseudopilin PulG
MRFGVRACAKISQEGFLYVELLISLVILALVLLAVMPLFIQSLKENAAASDLTFATTAALDKAEALTAEDFSSLSDGQDSLTLGASTFTRSWSVQDDVPQTGMKTVTVTVVPDRGSVLGENRVAVLRFYRVR